MIKKQSWGAAPPLDATKIDADFLKRLRQLCHPDKHSGSELSRKVWDRLELVRKALDVDSGKKL